METTGINLFVYDTMVKGRTNNSLFHDSAFLGSATLTGFDSYDMGTFISLVPGNGSVRGEVYTVNLKKLKEIDRFQGYGKLFKRTTTTCLLENGESLHIDVYVLMDQCFARDNRKL